MKISYNWLNEYCNCPNINKLEEDLNRIGFEVESIEKKGHSLSNIVIGKILSFEQHPDADRLRIAQVDIGNSTTQIVTAAENVNAGDIIPVSLPGATLASGLKIKKSKLRGIESNGMMCSAVECGLTDDAEGVWVLPKNSIVGNDFIADGQLCDFILDVSVLPNRGDCLSIYGLARECRAVYGKKEIELSSFSGTGDAKIKLTVDQSVCSFYQATKIANIDPLAETPITMQVRLYYSGMRPISWLVDVTNYVMLEYGQPLHAFDATELNDIKVISGEDQDVDLLNEKNVSVKQLPIVKVGHKVGAIAGVIGALGSEVKNKTSEIILESAIFDSIQTRKATKELGFRTESSNRFEKGVDAFHLECSVRRVIELLSSTSKISVCEPVIVNYLQDNLSQIQINQSIINNFLGSSYDSEDFIRRLTPLGFKVFEDKIDVPIWRQKDCKKWPDIAEEMIRFDGMETVKPRVINKMVKINHNSLYKFEQLIRNRSVANGLTEVITFPLLAKDIEPQQKKLTNPISEDLSVLCSNGIQSLLECAKYNSKHHNDMNQIFSIGPTWSTDGEESTKLSIFIQGPRQFEPYLNSEYHTKTYDFYDSKGLLESIVQLSNLEYHRTSASWFHPGQSANALVNGDIIGTFGVIHPSIQKEYKCGISIAVELNLSKLLQMNRTIEEYKPISKYPSTTRDVTYIIPKSVSVSDILNILNDKKPYLCKSIRCCGYYKPTTSDDISVSFRMTYQDDNNSCDTESINNIHKELAELITTNLPCRFP